MEAKIPTFSELFTFGCLFVLLANPAGFGKKQYGVSQSAFVYNGKPMCIRLSGTCPPSPGSQSSQKTENTQDSTSAPLPGRPIKEQLRRWWRRRGLGDLKGVEVELGERVFTLTPGARPVCCATVFMSILLCCCNFLFAPFSPFRNLHIGVQSGKAVAFVGGMAVGWVGGWCF